MMHSEGAFIKSSDIEIRSLVCLKEFEACVELQQSVWKYPDLDVIPRRMFVVACAIGGQVFGAWDGERLAGYALAIPGYRNGRSYLHSHMLAVLPEYRNRGIGVKLKLAQRDDALARGIDCIEWTFDPTQVKNAFLNVEKLGAIARRYSVDFYGASKSPLHGQLPTDRLHAEWWLRSRRVEQVLAGRGLPQYTPKDTITVPYNSAAASGTLQPSPASAMEEFREMRRKFLAAFADHLAVVGFEISDDGARYLLGSFDDVAERIQS